MAVFDICLHIYGSAMSKLAGSSLGICLPVYGNSLADYSNL